MIYFLHGDIPLQLKFDDLIKKIRKENPNIPEKHFDLSQDDIDEIFQTLSTDSMFIPKSLIVIKRLEKTSKLKTFIKSLKEFNYNKKIVILLYEEEINDYGKTVNELDKISMKHISSIAEIIPARKKEEKKSLMFFVEKELQCSEYEANKFIEMIGEDVFKIKNEIIKAKNFLNGEAFDLERVKPILSISEEYNIFKLIENFLMHKETKDLIEYLKKEKSYILFLYVLADELGTLYKLKDLEERGIINPNMSFNMFKDRVYPQVREYFVSDKLYFVKTDIRYTKAYPIFLKFRCLNLYTSKFLKKKLRDLLLAESDFKLGLMDLDTCIEKFILTFHNN